MLSHLIALWSILILSCLEDVQIFKKSGSHLKILVTTTVTVMTQNNSRHAYTGQSPRLSGAWDQCTIVLPSMSRSSMWFLPSGFHTINFCTFILSPTHATWPTYIILLDIIIIIILLDEYKPLSYSLSSFIQSPVTFSLCSPNVPFSTALYRIEYLASASA